MSLYDDLRKKLTPEQFTSITDALGDDFNYDVVPRTRLNKVIKQRDQFKEQLELGTQPKFEEELDDTDDLPPAKEGTKVKSTGKAKPVDEAALRAQFEAEKETALQEQRVQFAVLNELREKGAIDAELALSQLDMKAVKMEGNALVGLDDQLTQLQTSKSFLFSKQPPQNRGTGKQGGEPPSGAGGATSKKEFLDLPVEEQIKFKTEHPDLFRSFLS